MVEITTTKKLLLRKNELIRILDKESDGRKRRKYELELGNIEKEVAIKVQEFFAKKPDGTVEKNIIVSQARKIMKKKYAFYQEQALLCRKKYQEYLEKKKQGRELMEYLQQLDKDEEVEEKTLSKMRRY